MGSDSQEFDPAAPAVSAAAPLASESLADSAADLLAAIGYEAADPSLQSPQWHETMRVMPGKRDWR